jgi:hypothetical protein
MCWDWKVPPLHLTANADEAPLVRSLVQVILATAFQVISFCWLNSSVDSCGQYSHPFRHRVPCIYHVTRSRSNYYLGGFAQLVVLESVQYFVINKGVCTMNKLRPTVPHCSLVALGTDEHRETCGMCVDAATCC